MNTLDTDLPAAALQLARIFAAGGRLIVAAPGRFDHAQHIAVEFVHPAVTGASSLPAIAVTTDQIEATLRTGDALIILDSHDRPVDGEFANAAHVVVVDPSLTGSALVRWYHVLWELVQLGLEHPGLTGGTATAGGDSTSFLYPFLDAAETSDTELLASGASSWAAKQLESEALCARTLEAHEREIEAVAMAIGQCAAQGGTVYAIGNGGSSTDAARLVRLLQQHHVPARSLASDTAVLTALANDLGVEKIFARQIEAMLRPGDLLVVFSTSGASPNLLAALDVAARQEATVIVSAGYGGGPMSDHPGAGHRLIIDSTSVHRIQEAQGALIDQICHHLKAQLESNA